MPKLTLYFSAEFDDPAWAGSSFCLDAPEGDHAHGRPGEWVLGRHPAADITITTPNVSARHAAIAYSYASDSWSIQDLNSTNGTRLNGERLEPGYMAPIKVGDKLHLASALINVVEDENDTVNDGSDGPPTVASLLPITHIPPPSTPPPPSTYADSLKFGLQWLLHADTRTGAFVRLLAAAGASVVVVLIWG